MYKLLLCLRYLRTRYIALASIISVMLGVATMIVVNSVMAGFSTEMRDRIHGLLADVVVETHNMDGVYDATEQMSLIQAAAGQYIEFMTPTVEVYGIMTFDFAGTYYNMPVTLIGIEPEGKAKIGPLVDYLDSYKDVMEDGQLKRPALRSRDVPPGWELTAEAMDRRRIVKEREYWLMQNSARRLPTAQPAQAPVFDDEAGLDDVLVDGSDTPPTFVDYGSPESETTPAPAVAGPSLDIDIDDESDPFHEFQSQDTGPNFDAFPARLYVGSGLVSSQYTNPETGETETLLLVKPGDDVAISTVTAGKPPGECRFQATVTDVFKSGMSEYDSSFVFMNLDQLQANRGMIVKDAQGNVKSRSITSTQIKLRDYADAPEVVKLLQAAFPPGVVQIRTWEQKQGPLLEAVAVESAILNVLLFLIIAVAGFGILAIFFMIVVEKTRDIGIMKALGASSKGVMSIFLSYGLALGVVGSGVGVALGLLFVNYINEIEDGLSWFTGRKVFDEKIYYFFEIPTRVNPAMVVWVAVGAMTIAVLASVLPARRAARLNPVEALRYDG
jgi:lipoprotein-releasing system permease protein